jgi:hypothetical protein
VPFSILFQRGIYPDESFKQQPYVGLSMPVTTDKNLKQYLDTVMSQMQGGCGDQGHSATDTIWGGQPSTTCSQNTTQVWLLQMLQHLLLNCVWWLVPRC